MEIRRDIVNFPPIGNGPPKPKARLLQDVVEIQTDVVRAVIGDRVAQELSVFRQDGIELCFRIAIPRSPPTCTVDSVWFHKVARVPRNVSRCLVDSNSYAGG